MPALIRARRWLARWRYRAGRLVRLPPRELADLCAAAYALAIARGRRRRAPTGGLLTFTRPPAGPAEADMVDQGARVLAQRLALAVARAAEHGPIRATCLERAVALDLLLRRHGITAGRIAVGVRWRDDRFLAHAWIELGDRVLLDLPHRVRAFTLIGLAEARAP
jgi:hypothetical protein